MLILFTEISIVTFINDIYNFIVEVAVCQPFYLINECVCVHVVRRVRRPIAEGPVHPECCGASGHRSQTTRPHHARSASGALAACSSACWVQGRIPGISVAGWPGSTIHRRRHPTRCRQRSPTAAFCRRQDVHRHTDPQQLRWPQLHCSRPMRVEQAAGASTTGHELRTLQAPTENISVCELVSHGALWLLLWCAIEVLLLTYLLTSKLL